MTESQDKPQPLSTREAEALLEQVADVIAAGLPLAAGLRAAAEETSSRRLRSELCRLAAQLDAGRALDELLAAPAGRWSGYVGGLVRAGVRTGRPGIVLLELVDQQRRLRELSQSLRSALAYPALLLILALGIGLCLEVALVGPILQMFQSFHLTLPYLTELLVRLKPSPMGGLLVIGFILAIGALLFRLLAGPARWRRALATVPLLGALWHWSGVAELTCLWAVLLDQDVPLPETLRLAADGVRDANLREFSGQLAEGVQQGQSLTELLAKTRRLPASLGPLLGLGERSGRLAEACRVASEMFEGRVRLRADLLRSILPFAVFLGVAVMALFYLIALYVPMLSLIQGLS